MRMREYDVFFRWTCGRDVVNDGTITRLVEELESLRGEPFSTYQPLGVPSSPVAWTEVLREQKLAPLAGGGANQQVRFRLDDGEGKHPVHRLEVQASAHPYTGRYVTTIDVRVAADFLEESRIEEWVARFRRWLETSAAICGHAHDADDDAIQNIASPALLKRGYGVDVQDVDLADNPGRETTRGEHRLAVNWLTWFSAETLEQLPVQELRVDSVEAVKQDDGLWIRLYELPQHPEAPEKRERQRQVRDELKLQEVADRRRRSFGFWQRK